MPWYVIVQRLTCTHANVTEKAVSRACAELGLIFVAPTPARDGEGVPRRSRRREDFGLGAASISDARAQIRPELPDVELCDCRTSGLVAENSRGYEPGQFDRAFHGGTMAR